jgi:ABC-2 type transport system permease protein
MFSALARITFRTQLAYRSQLWALLFSGFIGVVARVSIWSAVYGGPGEVAGVTLTEMITYAIIGGTVLSSWDATQVVREVGTLIRSGDIAAHLLRPFHYPIALLAEQVGIRLFNLLLVALPVTLVSMLVYGIVPPASPAHALIFLGLVAISVLIIFATGIIFALLSFWVLDVLTLEWFMRGMLAVFSGGLVPLWFFPPVLAQFVGALPFAYITYYPMAAYLGVGSVGDTALMLLGGVAWVVALSAFIAWLWSRLTYRLVVQGG